MAEVKITLVGKIILKKTQILQNIRSKKTESIIFCTETKGQQLREVFAI